MAHYLLTPFGSGGDVNPFLGMAKLLQTEGHDVTLITANPFRAVADKMGVPFVGVGSDADYEQIARDKNLWNAWRATSVVFKAGAQMLEAFVDAIVQQIESNPSQTYVLVSSFPMPAARLVSEARGIPLVTVHLQPIAMFSVYDRPVYLQRAPWLSHLPIAVKRWAHRQYSLLDYYLGPELRRLAQQYGVKAPRRFLQEWLHSKQRNLLMWPSWFAEPQQDWPQHYCCAGFSLEDLGTEWPLDEALLAYLRKGAAPVLITAGTGNAQSAEFLRKGLQACQQAGRRALIGTRYTEVLPANLPDWAYVLDYAPFSTLLPYCAGILHHGGVGTLAQAIAAAKPQLIHPLAHDQPDNAARLQRLGLAKVTLNVEHMVEAMQRLEDAAWLECCQIYQRKLVENPSSSLVLNYLLSVLPDKQKAEP